MQTTAASSRGRAEGSLWLRIDRTSTCEDLVSQAFEFARYPPVRRCDASLRFNEVTFLNGSNAHLLEVYKGAAHTRTH